jgi:hypothetical protein
MATVKRETKEIEVVVKKIEPVIILELTEEEAQTVHDVFRKVGGDPRHSRRKHTQVIHDQLRQLGFRSDDDSKGPADIFAASFFTFLQPDGSV